MAREKIIRVTLFFIQYPPNVVAPKRAPHFNSFSRAEGSASLIIAQFDTRGFRGNSGLQPRMCVAVQPRQGRCIAAHAASLGKTALTPPLAPPLGRERGRWYRRYSEPCLV